MDNETIWIVIMQEVSKLRMLRDVLEDKLQSLEWALRYKNFCEINLNQSS
jgi:hypothetical protein